MWVMLDGERHPINPRHSDFILASARKWHKTPEQALNRIVNGGLCILMKTIGQAEERAAKPQNRREGGS